MGTNAHVHPGLNEWFARSSTGTRVYGRFPEASESARERMRDSVPAKMG